MQPTVLFTSLLLLAALVYGERAPKIAIIGGGIAGTGACYFAKQRFENVDVHLFEPERLGGRIRTGQLGERRFELGAHIVSASCKYIHAVAEHLQIEQKPVATDAENHLFNGKESIFQMGSDSTAVFSLLWQYGFGLSEVTDYLKELDQAFAAIYVLQAEGYAFTNLTGMLRALDALGTHDSLLSLMGKDAASVFQQKGFSEEFLREILQALEYKTYGQSVDKTNFVAALLPLSAGIGGEITVISGGTAKLAERLAEDCKPSLSATRVAKIVKNEQNDASTYTLLGDDGQVLLSDADFVIVAAPQIAGQSPIEYANARFDLAFSSYYVTLVNGKLNSATFPFASSDTAQNIYSFAQGTSFFSVERLFDLDGQVDARDEQAYFKVVSPHQLQADDLAKLFAEVRQTHAHKWLVSPDYAEAINMFKTGGDDSLARFEVDTNLFYVTPIELMRSSMEHSLIAAYNAVLLAKNKWGNTQQFTDKLEFRDEKRLQAAVNKWRDEL